MRRFLALTLAAAAIALVAAWATSPDPRGNVASFEDQPLEPALASLDAATTLAQTRRASGQIATLLVTHLDEDYVRAVDLSQLTGSSSTDPFEVLAALPTGAAARLTQDDNAQERVPLAALLPAAPTGVRHIGTGTNFPEHAEEASSDSVFQFPKFGPAMGPRGNVRWTPDVLLDYEVELCMRFDRPITDASDFDAAVKGLFLCGDFTDRGALVRLVDPDNLDSGSGFSDGKSREDFYPSGGLLVIPRDWQTFVAEERMTTRVNGEARQDARGGEMTIDFRALVNKALNDMDRKRFLYQGEYYKLAPEPLISPAMTLMSGTAEGVIFTPPSRGDIIEGLARWLLTGAWARGEGLMDGVIETFLANELASGHFLQPDDVVEHHSSRLGSITIEVRDGGP